MAKKSIDEMLKKTAAEQPKEEKKVQAKESKQTPTQEPEETHEDKGTAETVESDKNEELSGVQPTETAQPPVELTDNTSEKAEDHNEIASETAAEQLKEEEKKVVVVYVGGGTWRDENGMCWANEDRGNRILHSRQYTQSEYNKRKDLQFMVRYKSMTATVVE